MRRTVLLLASIALGVLCAYVVAMVETAGPARAAFPGQNGRIVFVDNGANNGLKLINQNGSGLVTLLTGNDFSDPAMSPDGTSVAYARGGFSNSTELYTINIANRTVRPLTNNAVIDWNPAWSPNGTRIAFERDVDRLEDQISTDVFVKPINSSQPTVNLTDSPDEGGGDPAWAPNGEEIAFSTHGDIVVLNLETGQRRNLTDDLPGASFNPNWAPNGSRIVFQSVKAVDQPDGDTDYYSRIYTTKASDGSDRRQIAANHSVTELYGCRGVNFYGAVYSPNGAKIAYVRGGCHDGPETITIITMNASDGSNKQAIYNSKQGIYCCVPRDRDSSTGESKRSPSAACRSRRREH
jgi:Tol biopolymer transport system component